MAQVRTKIMWQAVIEAVQMAGQPAGQPVGQPVGQPAGEQPLDILDLGGGTGLDAVKLVSQGHRVTVVDPSPDALASLARRSSEAQAHDRVTSVLGDSFDLHEHLAADSMDLVLCHGLLEYLDEPTVTLSQVARVLRPSGVISIVVPGRFGAVLSKALGGDFATAEAMLIASAEQWDGKRDGSRRYLPAELTQILEAAGFRPLIQRGLRVFADLVPAHVLDEKPGGREALFALEKLASERLHSLAAGLQAIARLE